MLFRSYKIKHGKEVHYAYSDEEKFSITGDVAPDMIEEGDESLEEEDTKEEKAKATKFHVQRYKGLGEMNAEELWETTMDPARRVLKQVTIEEAADADQVFDMLMGSEVAPRKSFIQTNAKMADLDI